MQVLLYTLIIVNLCGHRNGYGLSIVTTVARRVLRRPAESERKKEGVERETVGQREQ